MEDFMAELKRQPIWFLWQWKSSKTGKQTKVPLSAHSGPTGTSTEWAHTWVTYDEAVAAVETQHAAGIGFKVPEGYFFFDADDYALDDPFIQTILERFNSYTERSVSGGGIHIYGKCDFSQLPIVTDKDGKSKLDKAYYSKNPHNRLELRSPPCTAACPVMMSCRVTATPLSTRKPFCRSTLMATVSATPCSSWTMATPEPTLLR